MKLLRSNNNYKTNYLFWSSTQLQPESQNTNLNSKLQFAILPLLLCKGHRIWQSQNPFLLLLPHKIPSMLHFSTVHNSIPIFQVLYLPNFFILFLHFFSIQPPPLIIPLLKKLTLRDSLFLSSIQLFQILGFTSNLA